MTQRLLHRLVKGTCNFWKKFNSKIRMDVENKIVDLTIDPVDSKGYMDISDFNVFAWSISGIETSVVVRKKLGGMICCFDMGYSCRQNVGCDKILISHGHMDHISAVPHHIKKRELNGLKGATYYVPPHLVTPLQEACRQFSVISEDKQVLQNAQIVGISPGENIHLGGNHYAIPFPTVHRVASQGYLVYKTTKKLKPEFKDLKGNEIGAKKKDGVDIYDVTETPEVAFTGDTTFQVFTNNVAPPDLFKVKLLIMEATYLDSTGDMEENVDKARQWGHIHLSEIFENAELFKDIENILLIHMSDKYSPSYINKQVFQNLPDVLKGKVRVATLAKERYL